MLSSLEKGREIALVKAWLERVNKRERGYVVLDILKRDEIWEVMNSGKCEKIAVVLLLGLE